MLCKVDNNATRRMGIPVLPWGMAPTQCFCGYIISICVVYLAVIFRVASYNSPVEVNLNKKCSDDVYVNDEVLFKTR